MTVAQGTYKILTYKKQAGLGTSSSGTGGQKLRRETATFEKTKDAFNSNEITSHQQYTGDTYGTSKTQGTINGDVSAKTYADLLGSLNRAAFTSGVAISTLSITIAGSGPTFTLTRGTGSYLTDGYKVGDVVRITAGTYTGVARDINCIVTALTATVMTVIVANGKALSAQGPVASSTITVIGKKSVTPSTGQVNDYYTFEEWLSDASLSRLYTDTQVATADITVPANGNSKIVVGLMGLGRTLGNSQILTTPTAETTTNILSGENAVILINGTQTAVATSFAAKLDGGVAPGEAVIGSKTISDNVKGDVKASGSFTKLKIDESTATLFDNETPVQLIAAVFADATDTSDFVSLSIPRAKIFSDQNDDGKKQIIATHNWTAEYNGANGGAALATDTGIVSIQDSSA